MPEKDKLDTPVEYLKGVGPARAAVLRSELNIFTFGHLLFYFPFRYIDRTKFASVSQINNDSMWVQLRGRISDFRIIGAGRGKRATAVFSDSTGHIELIWFQGIKWLLNKFKSGQEYILFGKPSYFNGNYNIPHPEVTLPEDNLLIQGGRLQAFYNSTEKLKSKGLDSKSIGKLFIPLLSAVKDDLQENLPDDILNKFKLMPRTEALYNIHLPVNQDLLNRATARLKFEELFLIQLRLLFNKGLRKEKFRGFVFSRVGDYLNNFYHRKLPFELTGAQKRVIREIRTDLGSGKQMNRLLQGDVGSGKTLVALMTMLIALDNGYQACLMAPTEILANQHFATIKKLLDGLSVEVALLTGSVTGSARKPLLDHLAGGIVHILVGTHALIEDKVQFKNLGLVIIDEQHRFGVAQRAGLWKKNVTPPHVLVMTATPIPRTLSMTLYGDLDLSVIDEMPPGRKPVKTVHFYDKDRLKVFGFIRRQIKEGRQVYIVYPIINESEKLDLKDLNDGFESISREFPLPGYAVSMVHGQMNTAVRDFEMQRFVRGETNIMVSTTVIEVGVDIPNASVMVIENAERFGLSQLHQLRGRVGRGSSQSFCILMTKEQLTQEGRKRIQTMVRTTDGFEIAEADLHIRGPGEIHGLRQSGMVNLVIADLVKDEKLLKLARQEAEALLSEDAGLKSEKNQSLAQYFFKTIDLKSGWGLIS
ncbi:MAG: ATP-dependent DNA helicase RecG [Bacteroidales bacterium]|nr:ATP-dependent DNA helicase RecG [Bacteroidales bacterium]